MDIDVRVDVAAVNQRLLGMGIVITNAVPPGQFFIIDGLIHTSLTFDQLQVKLWVGEMRVALRLHIAELVEAAELRLFGSPA